MVPGRGSRLRQLHGASRSELSATAHSGKTSGSETLPEVLFCLDETSGSCLTGASWRLRGLIVRDARRCRAPHHEGLTACRRRHCEPPGRRKAPPDDRLREAIQGRAHDSGLLRRGACHRARIRATRWLLAMTGDTHPQSRGTKCPSCWKRAALEIIRGRRECRMRVAPVAACAAKSTGVSNYRYTATAGIPCTMVLTVSFVLSSVTIAWLPPSSADRSAHLAPALERQDHTTSPSAQPPFVRASE